MFKCAQLAPLRAKYADLFNDKDHTMRSFFAQQDHRRVFHYVRLLKRANSHCCCAAHVISLVGWLKRVKVFFFFSNSSSFQLVHTYKTRSEICVRQVNIAKWPQQSRCSKVQIRA